jgi:type II secretory pathway pseudopilin PulG
MRPLHKIFGNRRLKACSGFMLLGLLIILALGGLSLMAAVDVWTVQKQREREDQLLFVGNEYQQAIRRYYFAAPAGTTRVLPPGFEALLEDDRYPIPIRHLRRLYPDPITGGTEWGEVRVGERLSGVYSLSESQPIKQAGFPAAYENFKDRSKYRDWVFAFGGAQRLDTPANSTATSSLTGRPSDNLVTFSVPPPLGKIK